MDWLSEEKDAEFEAREERQDSDSEEESGPLFREPRGCGRINILYQSTSLKVFLLRAILPLSGTSNPSDTVSNKSLILIFGGWVGRWVSHVGVLGGGVEDIYQKVHPTLGNLFSGI